MIAIANPPYYEYKTQYPNLDVQTRQRLLKESIAKQPDLIDAYNDLAWLYSQEEKNLNMALQLIDHALELAPEGSEVDQPRHSAEDRPAVAEDRQLTRGGARAR